MKYYSPQGNERCGFIVKGRIVETRNIHPHPTDGFVIPPEDVIHYTENSGATSTWHTHPGDVSNLSNEDFYMVSKWPNLSHYIVGSDGVRCFKYSLEKGTVIELRDM